jgi:hypothetical protein
VVAKGSGDSVFSELFVSHGPVLRSDFYLVDRGRFYDSTVRGLTLVSRLCGSEANTHGEFPQNGAIGKFVSLKFQTGPQPTFKGLQLQRTPATLIHRMKQNLQTATYFSYWYTPAAGGPVTL